MSDTYLSEIGPKAFPLPPSAVQAYRAELLEMWDGDSRTLEQALDQLCRLQPYASNDPAMVEGLDELMLLLLSEGDFDNRLQIEPLGSSIPTGWLFDLANAGSALPARQRGLLHTMTLGRRLGEDAINEDCGYAIFTSLEKQVLVETVVQLLDTGTVSAQSASALTAHLLAPLLSRRANGCQLAVYHQ